MICFKIRTKTAVAYSNWETVRYENFLSMLITPCNGMYYFVFTDFRTKVLCASDSGLRGGHFLWLCVYITETTHIELRKLIFRKNLLNRGTFSKKYYSVKRKVLTLIGSFGNGIINNVWRSSMFLYICTSTSKASTLDARPFRQGSYVFALLPR